MLPRRLPEPGDNFVHTFTLRFGHFKYLFGGLIAWSRMHTGLAQMQILTQISSSHLIIFFFHIMEMFILSNAIRHAPRAISHCRYLCSHKLYTITRISFCYFDIFSPQAEYINSPMLFLFLLLSCNHRPTCAKIKP